MHAQPEFSFCTLTVEACAIAYEQLQGRGSNGYEEVECEEIVRQQVVRYIVIGPRFEGTHRGEEVLEQQIILEWFRQQIERGTHGGKEVFEGPFFHKPLYRWPNRGQDVIGEEIIRQEILCHIVFALVRRTVVARPIVVRQIVRQIKPQ